MNSNSVIHFYFFSVLLPIGLKALYREAASITLAQTAVVTLGVEEWVFLTT